ncbi:MAG: DUF2235 domain-containing protein [Pseudomonadota bacterium]
MKRIVLMCDGTWNVYSAPHQTHVALLVSLVQETGATGTEQVGAYMPGVGTGRGNHGPLWKRVDQFVGGAFGVGLKRNLRDTYRTLCQHYEPNDEVYIFGYSRGAYTARSLVGLIRTVGILPKDHKESRADEAVRYYLRRTMDQHPDNPASFAKRRGFSPQFVMSSDEQAWRASEGDPDLPIFEVTYLGVWDTVGALGVPAHLGLAASILNRSRLFHDTALSETVKSGRHAVSIDENRLSFRPTLWSNLADLNEGPQNKDSDYQEMWFPGDHGVLGGGGADDALSSYPLEWVVQGAVNAGLEINDAALAQNLKKDPMGALYPGLAKSGISVPYKRAPRVGPFKINYISEAARTRWCVSRSGGGRVYNPDTLKHLTSRLNDVCP